VIVRWNLFTAALPAIGKAPMRSCCKGNLTLPGYHSIAARKRFGTEGEMFPTRRSAEIPVDEEDTSHIPPPAQSLRNALVEGAILHIAAVGMAERDRALTRHPASSSRELLYRRLGWK